MHIGEHDQYEASHANSDAKQLPPPILCLQEDPGEENDAGNGPAIQEHHTRQGCVLISLHNDVVSLDVDDGEDQVVVPFNLHALLFVDQNSSVDKRKKYVI